MEERVWKKLTENQAKGKEKQRKNQDRKKRRKISETENQTEKAPGHIEHSRKNK
jgi:hypothetical protein